MHNAVVMRTMMTASSALQEACRPIGPSFNAAQQRRSAWSKEEEDTLIAFKSNEPVATIAARHSRTVRSIESRLEKLGLLTPEQRTTITHGRSFLNKGRKDK